MLIFVSKQKRPLLLAKGVRSQIVSYLEEHAFVSTNQSAYLKGHSTQTSLQCVIDDWLENINNHNWWKL